MNAEYRCTVGGDTLSSESEHRPSAFSGATLDRRRFRHSPERGIPPSSSLYIGNRRYYTLEFDSANTSNHHDTGNPLTGKLVLHVDNAPYYLEAADAENARSVVASYSFLCQPTMACRGPTRHETWSLGLHYGSPIGTPNAYGYRTIWTALMTAETTYRLSTQFGYDQTVAAVMLAI